MIYTKKLIVLIFLLLSCFSISSCYKLNKKEIIEVRGITVEIIGKRNDVVESYIKNINNIDNYLIKYPTKIILTPSINTEIKKYGYNYEMINDANAVTLMKEKIIILQTDEYDSLSMIHEFFHLFDGYYLNNKDINYISTTDKFISAVKKDIKYMSLSNHQTSSYQEIFVAYMLQLRYGLDWCGESPNVREYISEILGEIPEIQFYLENSQ